MWVKLFRLHKYDTEWLKSAAQTVIELNKRGQVYKFRWPEYEKSDANRNKQKNRHIRRYCLANKSFFFFYW